MATEVRRVPIPRRGVDYRGKVVLAPMVRSGELPSRLLALHYGADLVWGPETIDRAIIGTERRFQEETQTVEWVRKPSQVMKEAPEGAKTSIIYRIHPALEKDRLIYQMGTADPERAVQAARLVAADVAGIDVNAGCPKPFSTSGGMGAALLRTPDKLCSILEALVRDIVPQYEIGISVKIRLLETPAETEALVRRLVATGITALTIHCRTTPMRPRERAIRDQLRMIATVCREAEVACLMNGDVESRDEGIRLATEFGADGAMIATAAEKNPSCFRSAAAGGILSWRDVVEKYVRTSLDVQNRYSNTKYLITQMIPGKDAAYQLAAQSKGYVDICQALGLEHLQAQAVEVDQTLGIGQFKASPPAKIKKQSNPVVLAAGGNTGKARLDDVQRRKALSTRAAGTHIGAEANAEAIFTG